MKRVPRGLLHLDALVFFVAGMLIAVGVLDGPHLIGLLGPYLQRLDFPDRKSGPDH